MGGSCGIEPHRAATSGDPKSFWCADNTSVLVEKLLRGAYFFFMGGMHVGFSLGSANQLATLFNVKYGWDESQQDIY